MLAEDIWRGKWIDYDPPLFPLRRIHSVVVAMVEMKYEHREEEGALSVSGFANPMLYHSYRSAYTAMFSILSRFSLGI